MTYRDRIHAPGPKRLLALDGGGIRGILSLEILAKLEGDLREATGRADLVLADAFDYIGGTSTGAIIATGLALGFDTQRLRTLYLERGAEMFDRARLRDRVRHLYDDEPLAAILRDELGADTTLGSEDLRTLLLVVLRNATTDSPWPLSNNPAAMFNDRALPDCNLDLPLWQLVRASTAAPIYFPPETVRLGGNEFVFVDGGITPFNNPALQLFVMATAPAYRLGWSTGVDELLLVSVGTGSAERPRPDLEAHDLHVLNQVVSAMGALLGSAATQQDMLCRLLGDCRAGPPIDLEVGDLRGGDRLLADPLFTYVRYDLDLTRANLDALGFVDVAVEQVLPLDSVAHLDVLGAVGAAMAERIVDIAHLDGFLPAAP
ncbi:MAG: patatin-like phospholipase family protein [Acidimicrobiales bacterium]|nr:patatin-like phospholipase family protein [Acidimicrobiales bacterium]